MTLAEQLATLLEQGRDQPRHRVDAATELRRLRAEVADAIEWRDAAQEELRKCQQDAIGLQNELAALRQAANAIVDRDFTFFSGEMIGASRKITRAEVLALRAALAARKEPQNDLRLQPGRR